MARSVVRPAGWSNLSSLHGGYHTDLEGNDPSVHAIGPAIGHITMDGRFGRDPLKGALGDAPHGGAALGHSLDPILAAYGFIAP